MLVGSVRSFAEENCILICTLVEYPVQLARMISSRVCDSDAIPYFALHSGPIAIGSQF